MKLNELYEMYGKWLYIEDTKRIDVVMAVALSRRIKGKTPLWLILVGNSGDGKTEQVSALDDSNQVDEEAGEIPTTKIIHRLTARALVSGFTLKKKDYEKNFDLAPQLDGKLVIIPDMAQLLTLRPEEKAQVWAQLRDLYDGTAGLQTGSGRNIEYSNLNVTLIACATPAIDAQVLIHQNLGTRELLYRTKEQNAEKLMQAAWKNEADEERMKKELQIATRLFLLSRKIKPIEISASVETLLQFFAQYLAIMRAPAEVDSYSGELRGDVKPERPTRCLKQFKRLFITLKTLDDDYTDERALAVIKDVVDSSASPLRKKVFERLLGSDELTEYQLSKELRMGRKVVYTECCILWNLGILNMREEEFLDLQGNVRSTKKHYSINPEHELVKILKPVFVQKNIAT